MSKSSLALLPEVGRCDECRCIKYKYLSDPKSTKFKKKPPAENTPLCVCTHKYAAHIDLDSGSSPQHHSPTPLASSSRNVPVARDNSRPAPSRSTTSSDFTFNFGRLPLNTGASSSSSVATNPFFSRSSQSQFRLPPAANVFTSTYSNPITTFHPPAPDTGSSVQNRRAAIERNFPKSNAGSDLEWRLTSGELSEVDYWLGLLPFVPGTQKLERRSTVTAYKINTDGQMEQLLNRLDAYNLLVKVSVTTTGGAPLRRQLNDGIVQHLAQHGISMPDGSWVPLNAASNRLDALRTFKPATKLSGASFTHSALAQIQVTWPAHLDQRLVFISPSSGNLVGPIDDEDHACFPWRVVAGTDLFADRGRLHPNEGLCLAQCPTEVIDFSRLKSSVPLRRKRSTSTIHGTTKRVKREDSDYDPADDNLMEDDDDPSLSDRSASLPPAEVVTNN
uniref:Uncharacterized protein n=1 Tax=Mycena chlorophos TaxID=658473 RepID=A0ABQ0KU86_MYCCL|nr:predicted protein [Mycena chlorophos]